MHFLIRSMQLTAKAQRYLPCCAPMFEFTHGVCEVEELDVPNKAFNSPWCYVLEG